ncbi:MAG: HlyD family efflux transporter periplasmic adaptor subunit [Pirellulales bacterium]
MSVRNHGLPGRSSYRLAADQPRRRGRVMMIVIIGLVVFLLGGFAIYRSYGSFGKAALAEPMTDVVSRGPFDHIVLEDGEVESSSNIDVLCEVKTRGTSGTPILWVIDEGTYVKKGDKLVELDSSSLETELTSQRIVVSSAEATVISSKAAVRTAEIALQEYLQGTYQSERRTILSEIAVAEQELRKMDLNLASAERMAAKGMFKSPQVDAEKFAVSKAKNDLESANAKLKVLDELTKEKMKVQYESDIEAARAKLRSDESVLTEELAKQREVEDQMAKCVILSPADGVVVHNNSFSSRGGAEFVVEAGASVRERQVIIKLPDPSRMQVKAKVNESRITLIREGMPAKISITAAQNELLGRVRRVNKYAEPGSWFSSSVKEYATFIEILDPPDSIRTGMTAEVRIFVEQLPDALQIPVLGIYEYKGHHFCLRKNGKEWQTVEIKIGATNDKMITVEDGLQENDQIALNPRNFLHLMKLPEIAEVEDRDALDKVSKMPPPAAGDAGNSGSSGGMPTPEAMVDRTFSTADADKDGKITAKELESLEEQIRERVKRNDTNGDGTIERAEMLQAVKKRMAQPQQGGGPGGPGGGPGGPGGGGPGGGAPGGGGTGGGQRGAGGPPRQ